MKNYLLITGAYRSGTTLLDKLLNSHSQLLIASQVLQMLIFETKRKFLESRGIQRKYPVDPLFLEDIYTIEEFTEYINTLKLTGREVIRIFESGKSYSGTYNPEIIEFCLNKKLLKGGGFLQVFSQVLSATASFFNEKQAEWIGTKEVFSTEIVPGLLKVGIRVIQIIRDPRDTFASSYFGTAVGSSPPLLYTARMWRKQVALYCRYLNDENFLSIRYEDLVLEPQSTLDKIALFLNVSSFDTNVFTEGIYDQFGNQWGGNSSYESFNSISTSSVGRFKEKLPSEMIRYIEAVCYPEMKLMGYDFTQRPANMVLIDKEGLYGLDAEPGTKEGFPLDYSYNQENLTAEIERLIKLEGEVNSETAHLWFIFPEAHSMLKKEIMV